jgi:hypothetical protein
MAQFAYLINPDPDAINSAIADDVATAGTEAIKRAVRQQQNMQGSATFRIWLVPIEQVQVFDATGSVSPSIDVTMTPVPLDQAL